ncbi:MAG TPA: hypothetical protein VGQ67_03765, partial [Candidatus Polarisedimenticolia bacterium]|nr:hypothetical protein [Candidatus Polarisedimenticolia bacterium]
VAAGQAAPESGGNGTMSDAPKSAWELALAKLQKQDRERGDAGPGGLTEAQKKAIGEVRSKYQARLAEAEILHKDRRKTIEEPEALVKLEEEYRIDRRRLEEQRDAEITRVRGGKAPAADAGREGGGKRAPKGKSKKATSGR